MIELLEEQVGTWRDEDFITEEDIRRDARRSGYPEEEYTRCYLEIVGLRRPTPEEMTHVMARLDEASLRRAQK